MGLEQPIINSNHIGTYTFIHKQYQFVRYHVILHMQTSLSGIHKQYQFVRYKKKCWLSTLCYITKNLQLGSKSADKISYSKVDNMQKCKSSPQAHFPVNLTLNSNESKLFLHICSSLSHLTVLTATSKYGLTSK